jgi:hypothetical protein
MIRNRLLCATLFIGLTAADDHGEHLLRVEVAPQSIGYLL